MLLLLYFIASNTFRALTSPILMAICFGSVDIHAIYHIHSPHIAFSLSFQALYGTHTKINQYKTLICIYKYTGHRSINDIDLEVYIHLLEFNYSTPNKTVQLWMRKKRACAVSFSVFIATSPWNLFILYLFTYWYRALSRLHRRQFHLFLFICAGCCYYSIFFS